MPIRDDTVDLRQLRALEAVVAERNVSRAAQRLGVSQPALSATLARLRRRFGDPLLVRAGRGMSPTPRAVDLADRARRLLADADALLGPARAFEPVATRETFRVMATDYVQLVVMPALLERLRAEAPGATVAVHPPEPARVLRLLATGRVDLGIGYLRAPPGALHTRLLARERSVCVARRGHPALRGGLSLRVYCELPHVQISPAGAGYYGRFLEDALAELCVTRRTVLSVPNYLVAPAVVARSDLVATVPERLARMFARALPIQVLAPPVELPALPISLYWHERAHADPAQRWLRRVITDAVGAP